MGVKINRAGLRDWLAQRITAVLLAIYSILIISYLVWHPQISYDNWHALFDHLYMRILTLILLLAIIWHGWIGMWTVFTDYVKNRRVRVVLEYIVWILFFSYIVCVVEIFWR